MNEMMYYGYWCNGCNRTVCLGKIELLCSASPSQLHDALRSQGWTDRDETCDDPKCRVITFVRLGKTLILSKCKD